MMAKKVASNLERIEADPVTSRRLLIVAQLLALVAYALGLQFLLSTTGGTLFVFSVVAPLLVVLSLAILIGVLAWKFLRSHSLFFYETFQPGQVVFEQGDPGDCAYFIHSGEVAVVVGKGAEARQVAKLSQGQYFGEMALITSHPRNATVRAINETKVAVLGKENFLTLVNLMPSTREDIMKTVNERAMQDAVGQ
jgi:cyclic nucleotide-binding protein